MQLRLPCDAKVGLTVKNAKDQDTFWYWHVSEALADDTIKYKWKVTSEAGAVTDLGSASGDTLPRQIQ